LTFLSFREIIIDNILLESFDFDYPSNDLLTINFEGCYISEDQVENGIFSNSKRPLNIDFGKDLQQG
jgi:hypothetical protein